MGFTTVKTINKMKTPKCFTMNLKKGEVSLEMLGSCIYTFNKRAKNYRDNIRELIQRKRYSNWWEKPYIQKSIDAAEEKRDEYYDYKDYFLSLLKPCEIHKLRKWNERLDEEFVEYYLLYKVSDYSFHHPIYERELPKYNLEINELPLDFSTEGEDVEDLISVQFARKVYSGLKDGTLRLAA